MRYKVGDKVKILTSICEGIPAIAEMIGKEYKIEKLFPKSNTYIINGYAFGEQEVTCLTKVLTN